MSEIEPAQFREIRPPEMLGTSFDDFLSRLDEKLADSRLDKNDVVHDTLLELYLAQMPKFKRVADYKFPVAALTRLARFDPRNVTLETEYYDEIDTEKYAERKPLTSSLLRGCPFLIAWVKQFSTKGLPPMTKTSSLARV